MAKQTKKAAEGEEPKKDDVATPAERGREEITIDAESFEVSEAIERPITEVKSGEDVSQSYDDYKKEWVEWAKKVLSNTGSELTLLGDPSGEHPFMSSTLGMSVPHGVVLIRRFVTDTHGASAIAETNTFIPGASIEGGALVS